MTQLLFLFKTRNNFRLSLFFVHLTKCDNFPRHHSSKFGIYSTCFFNLNYICYTYYNFINLCNYKLLQKISLFFNIHNTML